MNPICQFFGTLLDSSLLARGVKRLFNIHDKPRTRDPTNLTERAVSQRYDIIDKVGSGSEGVVFKAWHRETNKVVAVKAIHHSDGVSINAELDVMRTARHPSIPQLLQVSREKKSILITTDFCEHGDIASVMSGPLPAPAALFIMRDVLSALAAMHRQGYAHRDVKPQNILLHADGTVRLADFGLACHRSDSGGHPASICGSMPFIAPEVFTRPDDAAECADVWSAGVTLVFLLTNRGMFSGTTFRACRDAILRTDTQLLLQSPVLSHISPATRAILSRMLRRDPAERPTAAQASTLCREALHELGDGAGPRRSA